MSHDYHQHAGIKILNMYHLVTLSYQTERIAIFNPKGYALRNTPWKFYIYSWKGLPISWLTESTDPT